MFEKEAEEYGEKDLGDKYLSSVVAKDKLHAYRLGQYDGFIAGAEFGYNKANEWQYVSEKGTPQKEGHYLVCLRNKDKDIFDCWIYYDKDVGWYSMEVRIKDIYAWKEIVPPQIKEE